MDELVALSDDPHPRGTRRIEWIGEQSPLDNDRIAANLLLGKYTPLQEMAIRLAAAKAITRVGDARSRILEHNHRYSMGVVKGLNRTYLFNKLNSYICDVDYHDVDIMFSAPYAHEFVDLDALEPDQPKVIKPSEEVFKLIAIEVMESAYSSTPSGTVVAQTRNR
jgi:hypothetical protein